MTKIKVKKITNTKMIPRKDGSGEFPVNQILTEDDEVLEIIGSVKVGDELEGEIKDTQYGKRFEKTRTGGTGGKATFDPEYLDKKNELSARQTALNCAVGLAGSKIEAGDKKVNGKETIKMAEVYLKWLKGANPKEKKEEKEEESDEELDRVIDEVPF